MTQVLWILRGLPASGKSTFAKDVVRLNPNWVRLERDLIRDQLFNSRELIPAREEVVTQVQFSMGEAAVKAGQNIIVSDMNLRAQYVRKWAAFAAKHGMAWDVSKFDSISVDECVWRDSKRSGAEHLGEEVIRGIAKRFLKNGKKIEDVDVSKELGNTLDIEPYDNPDTLPAAIIVDIDGTLAKMSDRSPYDWHRVGEDSPVQAVIDAVDSAYRSGKRLIFMSGRDASCRDITIEWLQHNLKSFNSDEFAFLFMRAEGDNRKDDLVKYELFNKHVRGKYHIKYVLDDRDQVIKMWRQLGLNAFQVNYGDF